MSAGADELGSLLGIDVEPNPERGQNSLTPHAVTA